MARKAKRKTMRHVRAGKRRRAGSRRSAGSGAVASFREVY